MASLAPIAVERKMQGKRVKNDNYLVGNWIGTFGNPSACLFGGSGGSFFFSSLPFRSSVGPAWGPGGEPSGLPGCAVGVEWFQSRP